jgi:hypothetical protein
LRNKVTIFWDWNRKKKLEKAIEENKATILSLEVIRTTTMELNEKLIFEQKEFLCLLNDMQAHRYDQLRLEDQIEEIEEQYQKASDSFDRVIDWQGVYKYPLTHYHYTPRKRNLKTKSSLIHGSLC